MSTPLDTVRAYHQRTKHHFERYAAGPRGLDWNSQPDPFRTYAGSARLALPLWAGASGPRYVDLYTPGRIAPQALSRSSLGALLELALGLSAWKQYGGTRWALRCNPSSGNLHPTEAYVVVQGCAGVADGVHHYVSRDHVLEQRCRFLAPFDDEIILTPDTFLVGLASIHWREAWKYGERAYRYCQHDAGHAIAALRYAAAVLGWRTRLLDTWSDAAIDAVLGTERDADFGEAEREHPDLMLEVITAPSTDAANIAATTMTDMPDALVKMTRGGQWHGRANVLSSEHVDAWPVIEDVARACTKPRTEERSWRAPARPAPMPSECARSAVAIIKQRRSAQAFDGVTPITAATFYRMLDMTLPRPATAPWDTIAWEPRVHLLLFVHRVEDLAPGLYLFLRNAHAETTVRAQLNAEFEWAPVTDGPPHFALWRLASGDARAAARALSCHQDIAADGAFSLGMLAEYERALAAGPWAYRQLFWEAGILGQVLYLEAEAAGVRGTGIGCYFDDGVHELLSLPGQALQSLYHFTIGGAVPDTRLQTLPAYAHLDRS